MIKLKRELSIVDSSSNNIKQFVCNSLLTTLVILQTKHTK